MKHINILLVNVLVLISIFFSVNVMSQHTYGSIYTNGAYINFIQAENKTEDAVIVMVPGLNLSTYLYATTPDGRKGWAELFADNGYDVFMVNDPKHDFATGGFVAPYTVPSGGPGPSPQAAQGWQTDIWRRWGFGLSQGNPYTNAQFPTNFFNVFAQNYPFIGTSNQSFAGAIEAVIDLTESNVWLLAHSAGAGHAVTAAREKNDLVKGLILIEPAGPPDTDDFPDLNGMHMLGVYGDYIISRNQASRKLATEAAAILFQNAGGISEVVSLPEDYAIFGNSHILMQDLNCEFIFNIIEYWLSQFSSTLDIESNFYNQIEINLYPNPATNEVWIDNKLFNNQEYSIYSMDGRLLRESTVINQKIDLSDIANGLLFVKLKYNKQVIMKKIIKIGL
jgi:pimeloyl-ACP methyl ester carboxylesterase